MTLAELTPFEERTRYFSNQYIRVIFHGVIDLLRDMSVGRERIGDPP